MKLSVLYEFVEIDEIIKRFKKYREAGEGFRSSIYRAIRSFGITEPASVSSLLNKAEAEIRRRSIIARKRKALRKKAEEPVPDWYFT